jgi:SAM-dependent methyltransferase
MNMNRNHRNLCASEEWGDYLRDELVPWTLGDRALGGSVLELGPGPGLTTELLRSRARRLTAVEADGDAAAALERRFAGTNVTVVHADGTDMPFRSGRFSSAVALTMLHHVPSTRAQDALFAEVRRVLRPEGWFLGEDSTDDPGFRAFHRGDVCVPVEPGTLRRRLRAAGFDRIEVERGDHVMRFAARRPGGSDRKEGT